jgi:hypothetical protein
MYFSNVLDVLPIFLNSDRKKWKFTGSVYTADAGHDISWQSRRPFFAEHVIFGTAWCGKI